MQDAPSKTGSYVLGLGSNLGDRMAQLRAAVKGLKSNNIRILSRSAVYRTPPLGPPQRDFFNAAVAVVTNRTPGQLIRVILTVEKALGRARPDAIRWGPRTIDIDVLWYAGGTIRLPNLVVPHPGLNERSFALRPLLDVRPDATDPISGTPYTELSAAHDHLEVVGYL